MSGRPGRASSRGPASVAVMTLLVAATSPEGRFAGLATPASEDALSELLDEFQRRGQGYLEVMDALAEWPMLAVGLAGNLAVIHLFESPSSVCLLQGARSVPIEAVVVPIMDELATFDSAFAVSLDTARLVVQQFARRSLPHTLVWHRL